MSNLKRFLSMALVIAMIVSSFALTVSAKVFDDVETLDNSQLTYAVDLLSRLGVIKGTTTNTFDPDLDVTRQQMALFIARIKSANPGFFEDDGPAKTKFDDVTDPTFYTAINYCVDEHIIDGISDTEFNPTGTVKLQEAVKMLVSALGHTGLSYPIGYLQRASEIGILDTVGSINYSKMTGNKYLDRAEVAGLLYNFFMSDYSDVRLVWNPTKGEYLANTFTTPVCNSFGVKKIEGYITGIEGFEAQPYTDAARTVGGNYEEYKYRLTQGYPIPVKMLSASATNAKAIDLVISYLEGSKTYTAVTTADQTVTVDPVEKILETTKKELGLDEDYPGLDGSRSLLGRKVITFVNTTKNLDIPLPKTEVIGTKEDVTSKATGASIDFKSDNGVQVVEKVKTVTINGVTYDNQTAPLDIKLGATDEGCNLYNFTSSTIAPASSLNDLARMIKANGNFKLEYVDNGYFADGSKNFYFVFTPYKVGYYVGIDDNKHKFKQSKENGTENVTEKKTDEFVRFIKASDSESFSPATGSVYLHVEQGSYITVVETALTRVASDILVNVVSVDTVVFNNGTTLTYGQDKLGSKTVNDFGRSFSTSVNKKLYALNKYDLYAYNGETIFAYYKSSTSTGITSDRIYGTIISTGGTAVYINNGLSYIYNVHRADNDSISQMMLVGVDNNLSIGTHVSLVQMTGTTYQAYTIRLNSLSALEPRYAPDFSLPSKTVGVTAKSSAAGVLSDINANATGYNNIYYNRDSGVLSLNCTANLNTAPAAADWFKGTISNNTKIVLVGLDDTTSAGNPSAYTSESGYYTAKTITLAQFNALATSLHLTINTASRTAGNGLLYGAVMVTNTHPTSGAVGAADVLYLSVDFDDLKDLYFKSPTSSLTTTNLYTITSDPLYTSASYYYSYNNYQSTGTMHYIAKAYNYRTGGGSEILVAYPTSAGISKGSIVSLGGGTEYFDIGNGVTSYNIVSAASLSTGNTPAITAPTTIYNMSSTADTILAGHDIGAIRRIASVNINPVTNLWDTNADPLIQNRIQGIDSIGASSLGNYNRVRTYTGINGTIANYKHSFALSGSKVNVITVKQIANPHSDAPEFNLYAPSSWVTGDKGNVTTSNSVTDMPEDMLKPQTDFEANKRAVYFFVAASESANAITATGVADALTIIRICEQDY